MTLKTIERALRITYRGTDAQRDALESKHGMSLSSIIDHGWADAEDSGNTALARRCEAAVNYLTKN